jgi:ABC-type glycerol-3-phosphate transport system substrate-binding protein
MAPLKSLSLGAGVAAALLLAGCARPSDGKIHLSYWEKWSGAEEDAMEQTVAQFNRSQDRIVVDYLAVGDNSQKTLLATAGGDPPDIAGIYLENIYSFADRNALMPLDDFMRADGTTPGQFLGRYARGYAGLGSYRDKIWAVPSTPTVCAFFWNKELFRAAGLDPNRPPRTLDEMNAMSAKLTLRDRAGNLRQVGYLPQLSGGWLWSFPQWFGGQIFDGTNVTIGTNPANLRAYQWMGNFSRAYGVDNIRRLASSFGSLASPDDPFNSGRVAMIFDGVWREHYMRQFAPGLDYGVAEWPAAQPRINDFTVAEADMLIIPRGCRHPREAWEFLRFISTPNVAAQSFDELRGAELLCFLQEKPSPFAQWSPYFASHHPNRDIALFRQLAESPHAISLPKMGIFEEYSSELAAAFDEVRLGLQSPAQALHACQLRIQDSWAWDRESQARRKAQTAQASTSP